MGINTKMARKKKWPKGTMGINTNMAKKKVA